MRVIVIDIDGLKCEVPLNTTIEEVEKVYNELKSMDSEMNIIDYKEVK